MKSDLYFTSRGNEWGITNLIWNQWVEQNVFPWKEESNEIFSKEGEIPSILERIDVHYNKDKESGEA